MIQQFMKASVSRYNLLGDGMKMRRLLVWLDFWRRIYLHDSLSDVSYYSGTGTSRLLV
jgi:hypothetical protein